MHCCVHSVCNFIGFCVSKSVRYGLEKKNEEPVNRCGTMKNPPSAAKQQIAEMVEVRGENSILAFYVHVNGIANSKICFLFCNFYAGLNCGGLPLSFLLRWLRDGNSLAVYAYQDAPISRLESFCFWDLHCFPS